MKRRSSPLARVAALVLSLASIPAGQAEATAANTQAICDRAAASAAAETGVPVRLLLALTRTETGRSMDGQFGPWPWTVNNAGDGRWFADAASAQAHVARLQSMGERNIDIGCFQINLHWHGHAFRNPSEMFDPGRNADYAAAFLTGLFAEFGTWDGAVAAFHSRTPHHAARYMDRYTRIYAALADAPVPTRSAPRRPQPLNIQTRPALLGTSETRSGPFLGGPAVRPLWEARP